METLFSKETLASSIARIENLTPEAQPVWGKMSVVQMLKHCSITMEVAREQRILKRIPISYVLGTFLKKSFYNDKPISKNSPTHPIFVFPDTEAFEKEKSELISHLVAFHEGGEDKCTSLPHAFFGNLSKEQWGKGMYKHLDHHLQQFGV